MSRTVHLHVGIAKTGTTYLQRRLFANRELLARHGVLYPGAGPAAHFHASLDLRGTSFKGHVYEGAAGAWTRLVEASDAFAGVTLISHETLARAGADQIERAVTSFATDDVRVVVTARDLARQAPAVWQEMLKNRSTTTYAAFLDDVFATWPGPGGAHAGRGFWAVQDVVALVGRWSRAVGIERVALVTVPPSGADRDELWRRFSVATELPDLEYVATDDPGNTSLGVAEAEVLRRLNPLLDDALDWPTYEARVKRRLSERVMAPLDTHGRLGLPDERLAEVQRIGRAQSAALAGMGVRIVGDLADLSPAEHGAGGARIEDLSDSDLLDSALRSLAGLVAAPSPAPPAVVPPSVAARVRRRLAGLVRRAGLAGLVRRARRQVGAITHRRT